MVQNYKPMKKKIILFLTGLMILILSTSGLLKAQEVAEIEKKGFVIIYACKEYNLVQRVATEANKHLGYEIDLRGLEYNEAIGLSIPEKICEEHGMEFPTYIQRGRAKDGNFISVEYTNAYNNFSLGYYIIVVASYSNGDEKLDETLSFVKKHYEDAYIKY